MISFIFIPLFKVWLFSVTVWMIAKLQCQYYINLKQEIIKENKNFCIFFKFNVYFLWHL